jgi:O-antigen/teichoic acid export membrane protein
MNTLNKQSFLQQGTAKRAFLGSLVDILGQVLRSLEHIILVPLFLFSWGDALYGKWVTLFSIITYFSLSDLGMSQYVKNKMTKEFARGNLEEYIKIFKSALGIFLLITGILFVVFLFFAFNASFLSWFNLQESSEISVRVSFVVLGLYVLLGSVGGLINGLYTSTGNYVREKIIGNIRQVLLITFIAASLWLGGGFVSVSFWYLFLLLGTIVFIWHDFKKLHPEISFRKGKIDWSLSKEFFLSGGFYLLIPLSQAIKIQGSVILIGSILGPVAVAIFSVHRTITNLIERITSIIKHPLFPEVAISEGRENYGKLQTMHSMLFKIALGFSLPAIIFLYFTGGGILNIWVGEKVSFHPALWSTLLIGVGLNTIWQLSSVFQIAVNKYKRYSAVVITSSLIGLGLSYILVNKLGLVGVVLGFIIPEILINLWWVPKRTISILREEYRKVCPIFIMGSVLVILLFPLGWLLDNLLSRVWTKFLIFATTLLTASLTFTYFLWFNEKERKIVDKFLFLRTDKE